MRCYINMLLTVVDILHFCITWEISEQFSRRDLKPPMAFLVVSKTMNLNANKKTNK